MVKIKVVAKKIFHKDGRLCSECEFESDYDLHIEHVGKRALTQLW